MTRDNDTQLTSFFEAATEHAPRPSDELMARILADAAHVQGDRFSSQMPAARASRLSGILGVLGGWGALAGLATATVAGVWIGFAEPGGLGDYTNLILPSSGYGVTDLMPGIDSYLLEDGV